MKLPERNLDVLRATAVMLVLASHLIGASGPWITSWLGRMGVLLFFVHTTCVLMASLERNPSPWSFYVRRAFRIYPLAIVVVLIASVLRLGYMPSLVRPNVQLTPTALQIFANLALMQDLFHVRYSISPLWTLPLEVQMYVVFPLCYLVVRRYGVWGAVAMVAVSMPFAILQNPRFITPSFAPMFLFGTLAFALCQRPRRMLPGWVFALASITVVCTFTLHHFAHGIWLSDWEHTPVWGLQMAFCFTVACAIPFFRDMRDGIITRAAAYVAKYSYGIYLTHALALWVGAGLVEYSIGVRWGVVVVLSVALPVVGYHLIEEPCIALGKRLTTRPIQYLEVSTV